MIYCFVTRVTVEERVTEVAKKKMHDVDSFSGVSWTGL